MKSPGINGLNKPGPKIKFQTPTDTGEVWFTIYISSSAQIRPTFKRIKLLRSSIKCS